MEDLMIFKKTLAAATLALGALIAVPANAGGLTVEFGFGGDGYGWGQGAPGWHQGPPAWHVARLSPQEVRRILRYKGYRNINFIDRRGPTYEATAFRNGKRYYVVVSSRSGDIVERHRI
jgi:hypothetical protein